MAKDKIKQSTIMIYAKKKLGQESWLMIIKTNYGLVFLTSTSELKISNPDKVLNLIHTNEMYNLFELSNNIICVLKKEWVKS